MNDILKLGVIGMSPGNAHPYSWAAIINGYYDGDEIFRAGYPGITSYLEANKDTVGIYGARVTHVYTQDRNISESIARASAVNHIVDKLEDMADEVDAVLLTRDDPENHVEMARPFIDRSIPIFIDKPLTINTNELNYFSEEVAKGKLIMSCSSLRYANECRSVKIEIKSLGRLELVTATGKKDWIKYGIHMLEGLFALLDDPRPVAVKNVGKKNKDIVYIEFENGIQAIVSIFMDIHHPTQISLFGEQGWKLIEINNYYSMFRDNIIEFIRSVQEGRSRLDFEKTKNLIRTLIAGKESLENGGKTIYLNY